jgi:hypothetical protein
MDVTSGDDIMQPSAWVFRFGIPAGGKHIASGQLQAESWGRTCYTTAQEGSMRQLGVLLADKRCYVRLKHTEVSDDSSIGGADMHAL